MRLQNKSYTLRVSYRRLGVVLVLAVDDLLHLIAEITISYLLSLTLHNRRPSDLLAKRIFSLPGVSECLIIIFTTHIKCILRKNIVGEQGSDRRRRDGGRGRALDLAGSAQ